MSQSPASAATGWPRPRQIAALPRLRDRPVDLGWAAVLWVLAMILSLLLIGFPAELVNSTIEENEGRIRRWLRLRPVGEPKPLAATWPIVAGFALVSAVLMTFGERGQIWPETALVTGLALLIAVPVVAVGYVFAAESYERRVTGSGAARLRIVGPAIALAVVMAAVSHFAQFVPGYVYGLVLAYAAVQVRQLTHRQEAVGVLRGAFVLLVLGGVSWAAWQFVTSGLPDRTAFGPRLFDTIFGFMVIMCCETLVIGLLPLRFLDGRKVWRWGRAGRAIWAVVFSLSVCLLAIALYGLGSRTDTLDIARRMLWLFGSFAAASVAFWLFFLIVNRIGRWRSARH
jgi:ABC-type multidrug transport system fused ATPase/permease subunit